MAVVEWPGIPEQFWPDTEKPWRVTWGIGCFKDFATEDEAREYADRERADWGSGILAPGEPFNAVEIETD